MEKRIYGIVSILLFFVAILILTIIDKTSNIRLSLVIQALLILYLSKVAWGCILYIKDLYKRKKYSYAIIMNLGLLIFLIINILRQINLLIVDWKLISIEAIYMNTIDSFSYFAFFVLPLIVIMALYSFVTNIFLIVKEGYRFQNLLGILFGVCIILGAFASQYIYWFTNSLVLLNTKRFIKIFIDISLNSALCYFYCITVATLYANIMAGKHKPSLDKDFVIILGCKIKPDGTLTPLLKGRVDKAIEFAKEQEEKNNKKIIFVTSGGKGEDESISEAEAMKKHLLDNDVNEENIIVENKSINTFQNMRFSKEKIDKINKDGKIIFSTTNYHVFRSGVIANNEGIDCEGMGSKTKWYFYTNALIREFIANLFSQKWRHIGMLIMINISLFILVFLGYKYNLM